MTDPFFKYPTLLATEVMETDPSPGKVRTLATGIIARDLVIETLVGLIIDAIQQCRETPDGVIFQKSHVDALQEAVNL